MQVAGKGIGIARRIAGGGAIAGLYRTACHPRADVFMTLAGRLIDELWSMIPAARKPAAGPVVIHLREHQYLPTSLGSRSRSGFTAACSFLLLLGAGGADADELSDLRAQM